MRAFIAIPIPDEVHGQINAIQDTFEAFPLRNTQTFHITLDFLGEITENEVSFIKKRLESFSFPAFTFTISKLGVFPGLSSPRVLWLSTKDSRELHLFAHLTEKLSNHIFRKPEEDFIPHITLARVKDLQQKPQLVKTITSIRFTPFSFPIDAIIFYQSELTEQGPKYTELTRISLHK